jgi:hypothetical protein
VFSLSRAKTFNLGRYPMGTGRRVHFDKPGGVKVFCEIHSHMSATVLSRRSPLDGLWRRAWNACHRRLSQRFLGRRRSFGSTACISTGSRKLSGTA